MKKLSIFLALLLFLASHALAQDWQYDDENDVFHNCDLIARVKQEFGAESLMKFTDDDHVTLAYFLDKLFVTCLEGNQAEAAQEFDDTPAEPETDLEITAVLDDHDLYSLDEAHCSVIVTDRFDEDLNLSLAGEQQGSMSADIYLPGMSQSLDLPNVNTYEVEVYGISMPIRTEWAVGRNFPLGRYTFDVHIADSSYRFQWLRREAAVNSIVVTCVELSADDAADGEFMAELEDGELYAFIDSNCELETSDFAGAEDDLKLLISAEDIDSVELQIFYPGLLQAVETETMTTMVAEDGTPYRVDMVEGATFPTGLYTIVVITGEQTYQFKWNRQDDSFRTIVFSCTR